MRLAPPSAHLRLARAVLALAVTLQSRGTELRRARMRDFVAAPEGVVVSVVVFGKVAGNRSEIPRHLFFGLCTWPVNWRAPQASAGGV
jgi:hypothetical protein